MLKTLVRPLTVGASTFLIFQLVGSAHTAIAQTPSPLNPSLWPLEARTFELQSNTPELDAVSNAINHQMADESSAEAESKSLNLEDLPIIGDFVDDFVDEEGNFDWGVDLPMDVSVGDVVGETGVILSTDFTVVPIERRAAPALLTSPRDR